MGSGQNGSHVEGDGMDSTLPSCSPGSQGRGEGEGLPWPSLGLDSLSHARGLPPHPCPGQGPYHNHLRRNGEADPVHVSGIELLHQHQESTADEGEDERGDVGVGEVFANVNEGLGERASCSWAPTSSSHRIPIPGCPAYEGMSPVLMEHTKAESWSRAPSHPLPPSPKGHVGSSFWDGNADSLFL